MAKVETYEAKQNGLLLRRPSGIRQILFGNEMSFTCLKLLLVFLVRTLEASLCFCFLWWNPNLIQRMLSWAICKVCLWRKHNHLKTNLFITLSWPSYTLWCGWVYTRHIIPAWEDVLGGCVHCTPLYTSLSWCNYQYYLSVWLNHTTWTTWHLFFVRDS